MNLDIRCSLCGGSEVDETSSNHYISVYATDYDNSVEDSSDATPLFQWRFVVFVVALWDEDTGFCLYYICCRHDLFSLFMLKDYVKK